MKPVILFILCAFTITPFTVQAQSTNGLSYSATNGKSYSKHSSKMRYSKQATPAIPNKNIAATPGKALTTEEQSETEMKVWEKYRALAGGLETKDNTIPVKSVKKVKQIKKTKDTKTADKPITGIGGLIEKYQANKKQGSQMRSLTVTKPKSVTE